MSDVVEKAKLAEQAERYEDMAGVRQRLHLLRSLLRCTLDCACRFLCAISDTVECVLTPPNVTCI